ncbi:MAG: prolipoprotein diacylglyceryl transferase [Thermoanaerobaculia bacterium]
MHPELLRFGSFVLPTYGVAMAIGFGAALWLLRRRAAAFGISPDKVSDLGIWMLLAGLAGAKILLVIVEWPHFVSSWPAFLGLFRSAGVFYGGLIGSVVAALVLLKRHKLGFCTFADLGAPCVALGQAIGRLGCLAAGCCWGREAHVPWAVTFTNPIAEQNVGVPLGLSLHPTQLYESLGTLLLCFLLLRFEKRRFEGETFARYLIGYALLRGTIEFFRGDPRGAVFATFSTSQFIAALGVIIGLAIYLIRRRHQPLPAAA